MKYLTTISPITFYLHSIFIVTVKIEGFFNALKKAMADSITIKSSSGHECEVFMCVYCVTSRKFVEQILFYVNVSMNVSIH